MAKNPEAITAYLGAAPKAESEFVCLLDAGHQVGAEIGKTEHLNATAFAR